MVNNEHAPNHEVDQYINPPLHPTNPKYAPEKIAAKLARKKVLITESMEEFGKLQAMQAAKQNAKKEKQRCRYTHGFIVEPNTEPVSVERTPENHHFFLNNKSAERFEMVKQGSAHIVSLLRMHEQTNSLDFEYNAGQLTLFAMQRPLAFFDREGSFYDDVLLQALDPPEADSGTPDIKHTATFLPSANGDGVISVPIDDIYCLSLASLQSVTSRKQSDDI